MDAYEATRIVFSRIQNLDSENAAKIMGLLLIQDHGEKEMIRLAFGPEALLQSVVFKVRKDLGLLPSSTPATPSGTGVGSAVLSRQNSARLLPVSPSSWTAAPPFSRTRAVAGDRSSPEDNPSPISPSYGGGDLIDDLQLHDQLSFLNEGANLKTTNRELLYSEINGDFHSLSTAGEGVLLSNSMGWGPNGTTNRHTASAIVDLSLNSDLSCSGFGWRPCLYFARGFCKNGNACRFLHDDAAADQELLLRSKGSKLMASTTSFPYSPTSIIPSSPSYSAKYLNFLHQHDGQRAAAAALMLNGGGCNDQMHNFMGRVRADFAGISNPGSRQIYLTFPADSTFREEDVSNYFSIYGPVQDVRIPYQQKRMFGFVTFLYPETVKLILAKGNPHFVCDARVLVKPYKEKGKVPERKQQQQQLADQRLDFSGCWNSTGLDSPVGLGGRMLYSGGTQDAPVLRRQLEEQQQADLLQQAIEMQGRRFQLMDLNLKARSFSTAVSATTLPATVSPAESSDQREKSVEMQLRVNNNEESSEELSPKEDHDFPVCSDHNLPDSPFASPTKASDRSFSATSGDGGAGAGNHLPFSPLSSCFFQIPARFSSGHGAVGM